ADLVTLSACRSSGARTYAGEGLVGLTWAFLQAGSRNVVAGLWDVADESTSKLMDRFYDGIAKGTDPAEALRDAQLYLIHHSDYPQPFYWGAFQRYRR
ncbi:MAG TPA: CHAT domain-containing protein, partial [Candidatus Acidoferrales bacterium]|nr:CHAT domain-containing protein [Candidatus Acidoferrales bacterium]